MKLHENLIVADHVIKELANKPKKDIISFIDGYSLFNGYSTKVAKEETNKIYEKIKSRRTKKEVTKINPIKDREGDKKNNPSG